jgi:hypothetical protein
MIERHVDPSDPLLGCPGELVEHIAAIEAGYTLRKPWKAHDEDAAEAENREEVRGMLARWEQHGLAVTDRLPELLLASDDLLVDIVIDNHVPSGGTDPDGSGYVECSCGWSDLKGSTWSEHLRAAVGQ